MTKIGYARVSSADQNLDRQLEALEKAKCKKIFFEKVSGKNTKDRTELNKMLEFIREGDEVVVISLDRLGRNNADLTKVMQLIDSKSATLNVLDLPSFSGVEDPNLRALLTNLIIEIYKYQAESERKTILERQRQGIEIAKKKGIYKGRKVEYDKEATNKQKKAIYELVVAQLKQHKPILRIATDLDISRNTVYKIKRQMEKEIEGGR
ncbi:recombinase family protein [Enterococcus gallinarum]|uniref:recombinase family protein n=1 Tax=Enterococcus gallinarum TaxID=1353 RepID=UPI001CAA7554|nr:recombinase family protein [Enterococcus gallinarum]